jgi:hypothetical protein
LRPLSIRSLAIFSSGFQPGGLVVRNRGPSESWSATPGTPACGTYTIEMPILADAGVPMLFVVEPVLVLALIPIVLIEACFYRWLLRVDFRRAVLGSLWANLLSTLVGVPLTWVALVVLELITGGGTTHGVGIQAVTWQAPWLIPYETHLHWMIPAAAMVLNLPFFLASVFIECRLLKRLWKDADNRMLGRACWLANGCSYGGLIVFWGIEFLQSISR